jgi:hypothetical protein
MKDINNIPENKLRAFVLEYARHDADFANALTVQFAKPDFSAEVQKISDTVASKIEDADDYGRRDSWCDIGIDLSGVYYEIRQRIMQGQVRLAFAQAAVAYCALLPAFEIQNECEVSDEAESYIELMDEIAKQAEDAADQEYIYHRCIELAHDDTASDYGGDYEDRFLQIAVRFITKENRAEFDESVTALGNAWRKGIFKSIQLTAMRKLDGNKAADAFIGENLEFDEIRKIAYDAAMGARNYEKAASLCAEAPPYVHRRTSNWQEQLFEAYQAADDANNMAQTAEALLLSGKIEYYDKLKEIYGRLGCLGEVYPVLLEKCRDKLSVNNYMQILSRENELALLFGCLKSNPRNIYHYGKQLSQKYHDEVEALFVAQIHAEASAARNRSAYGFVCRRIGVFRDAGFAERSARLIAEYKAEYNKRPAFVDELKKIICDQGNNSS